MAQGTEAAPWVSDSEGTEILTGGGATGPAPRSHQVAATRRPAQPPPAPAPKAQDPHLETRPLLIRLIKGCLVSCGRRCGTRGRRVPQASRRQSDARPLRRCAAGACLFDRRAKQPLQLAHRCCRWPLPGAVALDPYTEGEVALVSSLRPRWIPIGPRWWRSVELGPAASGVQELLLVVEGEETKDLASTSGSLSGRAVIAHCSKRRPRGAYWPPSYPCALAQYLSASHNLDAGHLPPGARRRDARRLRRHLPGRRAPANGVGPHAGRGPRDPGRPRGR